MKLIKLVVLKVLGLLHLDSPTRIVIVCSPLFVSAAGLIVVYAAKLGLPVHLTTTELVGLFATGATLLSTKLLVWLHGQQKIAAAKAAPVAVLGERVTWSSHTRVPTAADVHEKLLGARGPDELPPPAHAAENVHEIGVPE